MAALSEEEAAQLKALQDKSEAPDEPEGKVDLSRVLNISVDLGDDAQVKRAFDLGLLTPAQVEKLEGEGEGEGGEEEGPKRRGFFDGDDK